MNNEDKMFELMTKMYSEIQEGFKQVNSRIDDLDSEIKEFRKETNHRFDNLENKLDDLEATNATNHIDTNSKLNKISDEVDFLSHKEFQTEKEMFHLKQRLMKRKRNTK